MKIISLEIQNFYAIKSTRVGLADRGLLLIQGENQDDPSAKSNGAGKSSIIDALCWVLFGVTARGDKADTVVNRTAKKDCMVRLTLAEGDDVVYTIERYRKHSKEKNATYVWRNDPSGRVVMHKASEADTQLVIDKQVLGCSKDVFMASVIAAQDAMPDLPGMTDKQLKLLIEEGAGTEILSDAYAEAMRRRLGLTEEVQALGIRIDGVKAALQTTTEDLATQQALHKTFEAGRKERALLHARAAKACEQEAAKLGEQLLAAKAHELELEKKPLADALANYHAKAAEVRKLAGVLLSTQTALASQTALLQALERGEKHLVETFRKLDGSVGKPCDECGRPHTAEDLQGVKLAHARKIKAHREEFARQQAIVTQQQAAVNAAQLRHDEAHAALPNVSVASARVAEINAKLNDIGELHRRCAEAKTERDKQIADGRLRLSETNPYNDNVAQLASRLVKQTDAVAALEATLAMWQQKLTVADRTCEIFGPKGVRAHILDTVTPFLNERTRDYLSTLSDGNIGAVWTTLSTTAKGELREKFCIEVTNDKGAERFGSLSGGEKRKVRLACAMALQDLVAGRATKPINAFIADEIDHALDEAGIERLMAVLTQKAKEKGTVLIVSHSDMKDWCDQVITVTKQGGFSEVTGAI